MTKIRVKVEGPVADVHVAKKYLALQFSASTRNLEFGMSLKRIRQVLNTKRCAITGKRIYRYAEDKDPAAKIPDDALSFDRYDSQRGYVDDNVIAVSHAVNMKKANLSVKDIFELSQGVMKLEKRRSKRKQC